MWWLLVILLLVAPVSATTHQELFPQTQRTVELIYNMAFAEALQAVEQLAAMAPSHPAGDFYRAALYWQWRSVILESEEQQRLARLFEEAGMQVLAKAPTLPTPAEAAFYLGAMYGMQARMYFAQKHYLKALHAAKQGGAYLQRCVTLDPQWYDAYVGLGTYHYVLAHVPALWRGIVQKLIGIKGSRQQGLYELELARTQAPLAAPEATWLLAKIYMLSHEERYDQAAALIEALVQRYPHNFDYRYRLAYVETLRGQWGRAIQVTAALLEEARQDRLYNSAHWLPLLHYRLAETYLLQGKTAQAEPLLQQLYATEKEQSLRAWVLLRLGNLADLRGEHATAQSWYERVYGDARAASLAWSYQTRPFTAGPATLKKPEETI